MENRHDYQGGPDRSQSIAQVSKIRPLGNKRGIDKDVATSMSNLLVSGGSRRTARPHALILEINRFSDVMMAKSH